MNQHEIKGWAQRRLSGRRMAGSAGEGTRGGKIIGHTKSGKPIYASRSEVNAPATAHAAAKEHGYTAKDHSDASKALSNRAAKLNAKAAKGRNGQELQRRAAAANRGAQDHARMANKMNSDASPSGDWFKPGGDNR